MGTTGVALMFLAALTASTSAHKDVSSYSSMVMHNDHSVPASMGGGLTVQEPPKGWPFTDPTLQGLAHSHQQLASKLAPANNPPHKVESKQDTQYHVASNQAPTHKQYHHEVILKPHKQYHVASNQGSENNQPNQVVSKQDTQYHAVSNQAPVNNQYHHEVILKPTKKYQGASNQGTENNQQQQSASSQIEQYHVPSNQVMGNNKPQESASSPIKPYHVASKQATMQKRMRSNGHERASETSHEGGQQESEDFSPVSFVHSEHLKNLGSKKAKRVPQMKHTSAILGQASEHRAAILGPRQPRLEALHTPKKVVSAQNFQTFHGGKFTGPQQTSFGEKDVKPMEVKFEDSLHDQNTPKIMSPQNFQMFHGGTFAGPQQTSFGEKDAKPMEIKFEDSLQGHNSPNVVSAQNFQLFHGGKFAGPQQTSFGDEDVRPMENKPLPMRKLKKKKTAKPQGQEPSAVNVGYTIGFVNPPEAQVKGPVHSQVGLNDGILTLANDDIIVGKPASHIGATGASGEAASTQSHQIIHMIHTPQHEQGDAQIPTVHHILHNQPLNTQQLSDIFSNTYEGNKVYSHVMPTQQDIDYQIQTVPDQQSTVQQDHGEENGHVMIHDSPSADTIFYSPQQYRWKNVNGVEVASSIPVTEEQHDDLPNPHHKQPPPQRPPPPPQPQPQPQQQQPQAQALQQAPPTATGENDEQYLYLPVLEHAPSQHSQQTAPTLSHHGQTITYSQALPIISGPSGSSSNFDHKKALTHSVGFDYSNAMLSNPHGQGAGGQGVSGGQHQQGGGSFVIVEDGGTKTATRLNHEELNGDMDIKVEYIDVDANEAMAYTSPTQHGMTYELPKKTLGLPAEFPKGFNFGPMPVINVSGQNIGQHLVLNQNGGPSQPNYAQLFGNGNAGLPHDFGQGETGQQLTFGHELPVFPGFNFHGGSGGKGIFKQPNILQLQNGGQNAGIQGFGGQINSNSIFGHSGGAPGHQGFQGHQFPGHQGFPGHHSGRVMLSQGTFSGEGLPIAGLVEAGVPPFHDLKRPPMNLGGRPGGQKGNGGFRGGRFIAPSRLVQNFQQGRGQFGQQNGRLPNQGVIFHQFMLNPQQLVQNQGPQQGRPIQFPQQAPQPPQQQPPPPPPMNGPIVLSMNTLGHHHAVQNAIRNANQHKQNMRQNQNHQNQNQNHHFHIEGMQSNMRPGFSHPQNVLYHRERQPLKPRENQQVSVQMEKDKKHKHMQKQRNELAKYNSMLSVALFKPVGKVTSQYFIKNDVKSAEFPITSSFTLDLKPPPKIDAKK